ncbi:MAG: OmpA/MotB family protein, partial [Planctomycetota bacterium]
MRALNIGIATAAVLFTTGCVTKTQYTALEKAYREQRTHAQAIQATNDRLDAENEGMRLSVEALKKALDKRDAELAAQRRKIGKMESSWAERVKGIENQWKGRQSAWADKMQAIANQKDSGMTVDGNKLTLDASVFFKSGSAEVTTKTKQIILQVAEALKGSDTKIHVVGHTDSDPVKSSKARFPKGNWQLSGERAMSVLILMNKEGSIRKQRLSFEGRGDTDPVAPNDSK